MADEVLHEMSSAKSKEINQDSMGSQVLPKETSKLLEEEGQRMDEKKSKSATDDPTIAEETRTALEFHNKNKHLQEYQDTFHTILSKIPVSDDPSADHQSAILLTYAQLNDSDLQNSSDNNDFVVAIDSPKAPLKPFSSDDIFSSDGDHAIVDITDLEKKKVRILNREAHLKNARLYAQLQNSNSDYHTLYDEFIKNHYHDDATIQAYLFHIKNPKVDDEKVLDRKSQGSKFLIGDENDKYIKPYIPKLLTNLEVYNDTYDHYLTIHQRAGLNAKDAVKAAKRDTFLEMLSSGALASDGNKNGENLSKETEKKLQSVEKDIDKAQAELSEAKEQKKLMFRSIYSAEKHVYTGMSYGIYEKDKKNKLQPKEGYPHILTNQGILAMGIFSACSSGFFDLEDQIKFNEIRSRVVLPETLIKNNPMTGRNSRTPEAFKEALFKALDDIHDLLISTIDKRKQLVDNQTKKEILAVLKSSDPEPVKYKKTEKLKNDAEKLKSTIEEGTKWAAEYQTNMLKWAYYPAKVSNIGRDYHRKSHYMIYNKSVEDYKDPDTQYGPYVQAKIAKYGPTGTSAMGVLGMTGSLLTTGAKKAVMDYFTSLFHYATQIRTSWNDKNLSLTQAEKEQKAAIYRAATARLLISHFVVLTPVIMMYGPGKVLPFLNPMQNYMQNTLQSTLNHLGYGLPAAAVAYEGAGFMALGIQGITRIVTSVQDYLKKKTTVKQLNQEITQLTEEQTKLKERASTLTVPSQLVSSSMPSSTLLTMTDKTNQPPKRDIKLPRNSTGTFFKSPVGLRPISEEGELELVEKSLPKIIIKLDSDTLGKILDLGDEREKVKLLLRFINKGCAAYKIEDLSIRDENTFPETSKYAEYLENYARYFRDKQEGINPGTFEEIEARFKTYPEKTP